MSSGTFAKLSKGEPVTTSTLAKICDVLKCDIGDIISYVPRNGNEMDGHRREEIGG